MKPDLYDPQLNRSDAELAGYYGTLIDPARAGHPEDKPHVERMIPYVRESFWQGQQFSSLEAAQQEALDWCRDVAGMRRHGTTGQRPLELFEREEREHRGTLERCVGMMEIKRLRGRKDRGMAGKLVVDTRAAGSPNSTTGNRSRIASTNCSRRARRTGSRARYTPCSNSPAVTALIATGSSPASSGSRRRVRSASMNTPVSIRSPTDGPVRSPPPRAAIADPRRTVQPPRDPGEGARTESRVGPAGAQQGLHPSARALPQVSRSGG